MVIVSMTKFPLNKKQITLIIIGLVYFVFYVASEIYFPSNSFLKISRYIILAFVLIFAVYIIVKTPRCPKCRTKLPRIRIPKTINETLYGGWTCPRCKAQLDSSGNLIRK